MLYYILMIGSNLLLTFLINLLEKKTRFKNIPNILRNFIIGCIFGFMGIVATRLVTMVSVPLSNVRDSFTICAGLLFSGEAGIVSGIISGLYRFFSTSLIGGEFTRISCTITVVVAGLLSALMRKFFFKNKCPTLVLAFLFTISLEAFHMAMIFLTNSSNLGQAFEVVQQACFKVMISNSLSVTLSVLLYRLSDIKAFKRIYGKKKEKKKGVSNILLIVINSFLVISFALVGFFLYYTHTRFSTNSLKYVFHNYVLDIETHVDLHGPDVTEEDIIKEFDNYEAYLIDDILLIDKNSKYIYNTDRIGNGIYFPCPLDSGIGELKEIFYAGEEYYYLVEPYGKYYVIPIVNKYDIMFFRNSTVYMVTLLNVIIFSILFFVMYILLKTFVISNLRNVIEQTMIAKGDKDLIEEIDPLYFMPMSEELNYTFSLLYKSNTELTGIVKKEKREKKEYEYLADHDKLTNIFNREGFKKYLNCNCCNKKKVAFIFIDVDRFKEVNDTFGHDMGDKVLIKVTEELKLNSRSDDIIMRWGGDEFAMLLMGCTKTEKVMIDRKISLINSSLKDGKGLLPPITISAGCAFSERGYNKDLMLEADKALYESKNTGRGKCCFSNNII